LTMRGTSRNDTSQITLLLCICDKNHVSAYINYQTMEAITSAFMPWPKYPSHSRQNTGLESSDATVSPSLGWINLQGFRACYDVIRRARPEEISSQSRFHSIGKSLSLKATVSDAPAADTRVSPDQTRPLLLAQFRESTGRTP
jgi:hypothetical protein